MSGFNKITADAFEKLQFGAGIVCKTFDPAKPADVADENILFATSGGIKFSRMGLIIKSLVATVKETLAPDSARVVVSFYHLGRRILSPEVVKQAMTVFVLYVVTYAVGALVGIAHGYDATQSIFESVAMASNGGISSGVCSQGMPASLELFYMLEMWAGRLEFLTLIALIVEVVVTLDPRRVVRSRLVRRS